MAPRHEQTISRFGLRSILPEEVEVIAGPGCPVCVTPTVALDRAVELALKGVVLTVFGDLMMVPATRMSLLEAKARGGDVRVVYSVSDAVEVARRNPEREVVFVSVGFETTAPTTASELLRGVPENFSVMCYHRLIPPAMELLLGVGDIHIDGFICPGHVAAIIGVKAFRVFAEAYKMPTVVAGFEPNDVLLAVLMLLKQLRDGEARCENEYSRVVREDGNVKAQRLIGEVYDVADAEWRGIGRIPQSGLTLKKKFEDADAEKKYEFAPMKHVDINPGCNCHLVMIGKIYPPECRLFGRACTPQKPYGPCMVSSEGTCRIYYKYGEHPKL
ncbi:MAG: hydrogenase formation protein HypD [Candidatus Jordarchaeales archaeon]